MFFVAVVCLCRPPPRVQAMCSGLQGNPSEAVSFTTLSCEPDPPNPPKKNSGTKNSLILQWKVKEKTA